ncbi:MAG: hypothetical protein AUH29_08540 [Candidatus Rokubacteria bacterium 13_1_40CM_69_27]|nr:MAG: hypothetical protein AUH29_08540 [Candidatus Rokubacteria bacterium 13_1_40CM_69_27]OLC34784.1 MAG: hypothetical protein AUH81_11565 [Candidatus Rokubacteria bacterium 13_1_40CM_4_69_5]
MVVVGDVAHVLVQPELAELGRGDLVAPRSCMCARCSAGGSTPWERQTTMGTAQISHSAIQQISSS